MAPPVTAVVPPGPEPDLPDTFPYYACTTCPWFHRKGKACSGCPKKSRLTYDSLRMFHLLIRRAVHDLRATCEELDPEMKEGVSGVWRESRQGLMAYLEGGGKDDRAGGGREGSVMASEEETLGDGEWEARFLEVGEMVELYLRKREEEGKEGEVPLRKTLKERAVEEKGGELSEGRGGVVEKRMGRMEARDERDGGWGVRYEEIRAMVELEKEAESGVWKS